MLIILKYQFFSSKVNRIGLYKDRQATSVAKIFSIKQRLKNQSHCWLPVSGLVMVVLSFQSVTVWQVPNQAKELRKRMKVLQMLSMCILKMAGCTIIIVLCIICRPLRKKTFWSGYNSNYLFCTHAACSDSNLLIITCEQWCVFSCDNPRFHQFLISFWLYTGKVIILVEQLIKFMFCQNSFDFNLNNRSFF